MRNSPATPAALLLAALCAGCTGPGDPAPDDPATMIYRECMAAGGAHWTADDAGAAMHDPATRNTASFDAAAESKREQRQAAECLRQAGLDSG